MTCRALLVLLVACTTTPNTDADERAVTEVLDAWHAAAAAADEDAYFALFTPDGVFLGTDATERWDRDAFRAYAHPHFARGEAWDFHATRRAVTVRDGYAFFDEDLVTEGLGPARGSGVLERTDAGWRIAQYNLALTIPNERFAEIRQVLERAAE